MHDASDVLDTVAIMHRSSTEAVPTRCNTYHDCIPDWYGSRSPPVTHRIGRLHTYRPAPAAPALLLPGQLARIQTRIPL